MTYAVVAHAELWGDSKQRFQYFVSPKKTFETRAEDELRRSLNWKIFFRELDLVTLRDRMDEKLVEQIERKIFNLKSGLKKPARMLRKIEGKYSKIIQIYINRSLFNMIISRQAYKESNTEQYLVKNSDLNFLKKTFLTFEKMFGNIN